MDNSVVSAGKRGRYKDTKWQWKKYNKKFKLKKYF